MLSRPSFTSLTAFTRLVLSVVLSSVVSPILLVTSVLVLSILVFNSILVVSIPLVNVILVVSIFLSNSCISFKVAKMTVGSTFKFTLEVLETTNIILIIKSFTLPESAVGL
ncbi:hypothetical protein CDFC105_103899 [Clostridioides difficile]|nr:hypothetical protein CDFC105_103899 [Clostridioides difficile]